MAILAIRARDYKFAEKPDHSPVTDADIVSQYVILEGLKSATPGIPVISEEFPAKGIGPVPNVFWLVDLWTAHGNLPLALTSLSLISVFLEAIR